MMRFEIRTKRRRYAVYVEFHEEQYELDLVGIFGRRRKTIGGWEQIPITTNPFEFASAEVRRFELKEDYIDQYDDKVFFLDEEAEAAATVEESPHEAHEVLVNDWVSGKKEVVLVAKERVAEK